MKFRYLGEKEDMAVFGYDFSNGSTPEVTEELVITKLSGNSHFEAVEEDVNKPAVTNDIPVKENKKKAAESGINVDDKSEWPLS